MQAHLKQLPPAPTTEQATKNAGRDRHRDSGGPAGCRAAGSSRRRYSFQTYTEGNMFRVSVPSNWRELPGSSAVTFAPEGAYGDANGQSMFTHGVEIGIARNETHDLQTATNELIASLAQGNPGLSRPSRYDRVRRRRTPGSARGDDQHLVGRPAREHRHVHDAAARRLAVLRGRGRAARDFAVYSRIFDRVISSIQLID